MNACNDHLGAQVGTQTSGLDGLFLSEFSRKILLGFGGRCERYTLAYRQDVRLAGQRQAWMDFLGEFIALLEHSKFESVTFRADVDFVHRQVQGRMLRVAAIRLRFDGPLDLPEDRLHKLVPALSQRGGAFTRIPNELSLSLPLAEAVPAGGKGTILIVDDEAFILKIMHRLLSDDGFDVVAVLNGEDAILVARQRRERIGLVFCDMKMPKMPGGEVIAKLRQAGVVSPIVTMSGSCLANERPEGTWFLPKPFLGGELLALVQEQLVSQELLVG